MIRWNRARCEERTKALMAANLETGVDDLSIMHVDMICNVLRDVEALYIMVSECTTLAEC